DQTMDLISERIDLAIRITNTPDPNFIVRKLADCHSLLVATPEYLTKFGTPTQPEDLYQHHYLWGTDYFCIERKKKIWAEKMRWGFV
ncbi:LysR substrate-binding domain-containing protein, partial [Glaesserella parasuis]|nr:LysR substrate-binding domain-containing protein [Glaesserella parasuis]